MAATTKERTAPQSKRQAGARKSSQKPEPPSESATGGQDVALSAAAGDKTKNDPNQPSLPGMAEERVPAIERAIKNVLDKRAEAKAAKEEADRELGRLPGLLHKHGRETYKCLGRVVVIEPGADIVKIKKVKDK